MFKQVFNPDNLFWRLISRLVDLVGLSIFWALLSIPLVTCGAACSALYYTVVKVFKYGNDQAFHLMWQHFRKNLKKTLPVSGVCILVGAFIAWSYAIMLSHSDSDLGAVMFTAYCIALVLPAGILCYFFPILSRFDMTIREGLKAAAVLSIGHLPSTVAIVAFHTAAAVFTIESYSPIFITPVASALVSSLFLERIFRKQLTTIEERAVFEETTVEELLEKENARKNKRS